ncbi:hypothetical protein PRIPAC_91591, partial [Pristionchus pacificus]|uniref:Uncharacterized protein n=1 Tax=Pristionchus pacificus TaxID=54126 RepID=A0A2A6C9J3_PRIPA
TSLDQCYFRQIRLMNTPAFNDGFNACASPIFNLADILKENVVDTLSNLYGNRYGNILSGMRYFRVEVLPEILKVVSDYDKVHQSVTNLMNRTKISMKEYLDKFLYKTKVGASLLDEFNLED